MPAERILVAMSGGVDSSVAAALLAEQGHQLVGATMKTFCYQEEAGPSRTCCGLDGIMDARRVADALGIPHYVFDVEEEFTRDVIDDFVSEYARGRTPNPCVRCNSNTKFRDLLRRGELLGCDAVASGHYVRAGDRGRGGGSLPGPRRGEGSVLLPVGPSPRAAAQTEVSAGRTHQARGARPRPRTPPRHCRQARVAGDLLRAHRRLPRPAAAQARPAATTRSGPAAWWTPAGGSSAATRATRPSPWASGADWAGASTRSCTSSRSVRIRARWWWATREALECRETAGGRTQLARRGAARGRNRRARPAPLPGSGGAGPRSARAGTVSASSWRSRCSLSRPGSRRSSSTGPGGFSAVDASPPRPWRAGLRADSRRRPETWRFALDDLAHRS